jgi:hypothetical protein
MEIPVLKRLQEVKDYIDEHKKRPSSESKIMNIKSLGIWILHQSSNYKKNREIMKKKLIYDKWTEFINNLYYKTYFLNNEEKWIFNFNNFRQYVDTYNKLPSISDKFLYGWMNNQHTHYKNKNCMMKLQNLYNIWHKFINDKIYKIYFYTFEEEWLYKLDEIKKYIEEHKKKPSLSSKIINIRQLGIWFNNQTKNYKAKSCIMKNNNIYQKWIEFINDIKYNVYLLTNKEIWIINFNKLKEYIDNNNILPIHSSSLGLWLCQQKIKYKTKKEIMSS